MSKVTVDELQVLITANTKNLQAQINNANKTINGLQKSTSKTATSMLGSFKGLVGGIAALGIGKVIADSVKSGMDAIESDNLFETSMGDMADDVRAWSDEIGDALGLSAVAMRKNTGVIYNMTTSMGLAKDNALKMSKGITLLSEDMASFYNLDTTEAFNKLRAGLTGETEPLKALGILVDENTIKQVAYQQGIAKTGSELTQQQKVLARYVAILQQTGNAQGDLARTLDSPANQLRVFKNQVSSLGRAFGNLLLPMLQAVLPYLTAFTKIVTIALNTLSKLLSKVFGYELKDSSSAVGDLSDGFSDINAGVEGLGGGLGGVNDGLDDANKKAKKLHKQLASFDEMNVLQDNSTDTDSSGSGGGTGGGGIGGLGGTGGDLGFDLGEYEYGLDGLNNKVNEIVNRMQEMFGNLKTTLIDVWNSEPIQAFVGAMTTAGEFLWTYWSAMGTTLSENVNLTWGQIEGNITNIFSNLTQLWTMFWTDLDGAINTWGDPIIEKTTGVFDKIWKDALTPATVGMTSMWSDFTDTLVDTWDDHGERLLNNIGEFNLKSIDLFDSLWDNLLTPIIEPFLDDFEWLWDNHLKGMIEEAYDFIGELVNGALEIYNKFIQPILKFLTKWLAPGWSACWTLISGVVSTAIGVIADIITYFIGIAKGLVKFVTGVLTGDWKKAWSGIKDIFSNTFGQLEAIAKGVVNLIIDVLNGMIAGINKIDFDVPDWVPVLGGEHVGLKIPKIKKLAKGGIVTSPTYAQIGEAGKEAVLPLDNNLGYLDKLADKINAKNGDGQPVRVVVNIGEDTIIDKIVEGINSKNFETNGEVFA